MFEIASTITKRSIIKEPIFETILFYYSYNIQLTRILMSVKVAKCPEYFRGGITTVHLTSGSLLHIAVRSVVGNSNPFLLKRFVLKVNKDVY